MTSSQGYALVVGLYFAYVPIVVGMTHVAELVNMGPFQSVWRTACSGARCLLVCVAGASWLGAAAAIRVAVRSALLVNAHARDMGRLAQAPPLDETSGPLGTRAPGSCTRGTRRSGELSSRCRPCEGAESVGSPGVPGDECPESCGGRCAGSPTRVGIPRKSRSCGDSRVLVSRCVFLLWIGSFKDAGQLRMAPLRL